jgi:Asp-tRNA(Asn)/Glu-tRNA(Gln) amidotransferase A subunit family amidase
LVSVRGVVPLSWTLDHAGPMARTVGDVAAVLTAIAGYDPEDPGSRQFPVCDYLATLDGDISSLRLGIVREVFFDDLDPAVAAAVNRAIAQLGKMTRGTCPVRLAIENVRGDVSSIQLAEARTYHQNFVERTPNLYHPETLKRLRNGEKITVSDYIHARQRVDSMRRTVAQVFHEVDVLITPTTPVPPPTIADLLTDLEQLRTKESVMLRNTRPFNVFGLPTISVPCGKTSSGLPIGLQLAAAPGAEAQVLALAHAFQKTSTTEIQRHREELGVGK